MLLDPTTLGLVLLLVYLGNGVLALFMALSGRTFPGASLWVVAQGLLVLGALAWFLRPWVPSWIPDGIGDAALVSAFVPYCHAVWAFRFDRPFPRIFYALIPLAAATVAGTLDGGEPVRILVFSFWTCLGSASVAGLLVWRIARPYRSATFITALPFLGTAAASLVRLFWNSMASAVSAAELSWVNSFYVLGTLLLSTVTLFGYFMMTAIRSEVELGRKDEEIRARNRQLSESGRAKDLFFSIIAHDLRGPIGGAARYVRKHLLGKMTGLEAKFAEVETLASALDKTNEFLEKLLWWSRSQLEDWVPERVAVDLARTIEHVAAMNRSAADLKEIRLELPEGPFPSPWADPESVQLILGNLLSNAIKFTLPGRTIRIEVAEADLICQVTVQDEGVGMDPRTVERLFRIEDKLSTHGTSGERGSGLGLLLSRSLAQRNLGDIEIVSEPGIGTRATVWLPKQIPPRPTPARPEGGAGRRVSGYRRKGPSGAGGS